MYTEWAEDAYETTRHPPAKTPLSLFSSRVAYPLRRLQRAGLLFLFSVGWPTLYAVCKGWVCSSSSPLGGLPFAPFAKGGSALPLLLIFATPTRQFTLR